MLNTGIFWSEILSPLSHQRQKIISHLWENLNIKNENRVSLVRFKNRFFGKFHPQVVSGKKKASEIENEVLQNIDFHGQIFGNTENFTEWKQFYDFMFCWSAVEENENNFLSILVDCFRLSEFFGIYSKEIPDEQPIHPLGRSQMENESHYQRSEINHRNRSNWGTNQNEEKNSENRGRMGRSRGIRSKRDWSQNNIYGDRGNTSRNNHKDNDQEKNTNFYDKEDVNIYEANMQKSRRSNISRNYNIISGKNEIKTSSPPRSRRNDIRKNFYDQKGERNKKKRDISHKRNFETERKSIVNRKRNVSTNSISKSTISVM